MKQYRIKLVNVQLFILSALILLAALFFGIAEITILYESLQHHRYWRFVIDAFYSVLGVSWGIMKSLEWADQAFDVIEEEITNDGA